MKALVISPDPDLRSQLALTVRTGERRSGKGWQILEAPDGIAGLKLAWRELPDVVIADEIASGAGAFAVAKDLRGAATPFPGAVILILARAQDEWLAKWSGADGWMAKPVDPFRLADLIVEAIERRAPREAPT